MEIRNSNFAVFIDVFTPNTYIMVVMSEASIRKFTKINILMLMFLFFDWYLCLASAAVLLNIKNARKHFEKLERTNQIQQGNKS